MEWVGWVGCIVSVLYCLRRLQLSEAHVLRQSRHTSSGSSFSVHTDAKEGIRTVVCKVTADAPGAHPSRMRVVGASSVFRYAPQAGAAGEFDSCLWHASAPTVDDSEHIKVVYFWDRPHP